MNTKDDTLIILKDLALRIEEEPDIYETMIGFIQYQANQKGIEFNGFFRSKWEIEADHPMTFDDQYFEDENRSELYVYLSAEIDDQVFEWLKYAWNVTHDEIFTKEILHREIYFLKEQGITF